MPLFAWMWDGGVLYIYLIYIHLHTFGRIFLRMGGWGRRSKFYISIFFGDFSKRFIFFGI